MLKAWLVSLLILILFVMAYALDLFEFLASDAVQYISIGLVAVMLIVARIILGNPLKQDNDDEQNDD